MNKLNFSKIVKKNFLLIIILTIITLVYFLYLLQYLGKNKMANKNTQKPININNNENDKKVKEIWCFDNDRCVESRKINSFGNNLENNHSCKLKNLKTYDSKKECIEGQNKNLVYCLSKDLKCEELDFTECNNSSNYVETYNSKKNCLSAKNNIENCLRNTQSPSNVKKLTDCI